MALRAAGQVKRACKPPFEASRRSREGSPLLPGLIWRFCSPSGFACAIGNCSLEVRTTRYLLRDSVRSEVRLASKQLQGSELCEGRVSSSTESLQAASLAVRGASGVTREESSAGVTPGTAAAQK